MKVNQTAKFFEKFTVKSDLMGLAIGSHGSNILKARDVPGITSIEVEDETCTIKVAGEVKETRRSPPGERTMSFGLLQSEKAVKEARGILEYIEDMVLIPRESIGKRKLRRPSIINSFARRRQSDRKERSHHSRNCRQERRRSSEDRRRW